MFNPDFSKCSATFACCLPSDADASNPNQQCSAANPPYTITVDHQHDMHIHTEPATSRSNHWLQTNLLPKLRNWSVPVTDASQEAQRTSIGTHAQLHSQEEYITLYNALKTKYGLDMVQRWPEQTDAAKFVYEDVAIASYLLVLWRQEREASGSSQLQSFVDLGCGNGLLVYILSSEGHRGYGIDLRKRGIWDMYPATTQLRIEAIVPSDESLYPDTDWIIGNHSDELSPWIPVIAARSAPTTRYFLLPCCAFEFNGHKFQRRSAGDSQYNGFLDYVKRISEECGFETAMDRLKIPSTKRVCLIGRRPSGAMTDEQFAANSARIQRFIDGETKTEATDTRRAWSAAFTPRPSVEEVRNCSKLERSLQTEIVQQVVDHLLAKRRFLDTFPSWNIGGQCPISDLIKLFPGELLKQMKSECGGLQTLLRNHNQVFLVQQGTVQIRAPLTKAQRSALVAEKKLKALVKQRSCWFKDNHPDGCPIASEDCNFLHSD